MSIINDLFKKKWATNENIELAAEIDAKNAAANVLVNLDIDNGLGNIRLKDIFNNVLCNKFGYDYTIIYIDSWLKYWTGRYSIKKGGKKQETETTPDGMEGTTEEGDKLEIPKEHLITIKNCIYYSFKWNLAGVGELNGEIFSGSLRNTEYDLNGEIKTAEVVPWTWSEINTKGEITYKNREEGSKGNNIYLQIERDGIGHFIKLLKFIQVDIYLNRLVAINATRFIEKWGVEVRDPGSISDEIDLFLSPDSNFFAKVVDIQNGKMSNNFIPPASGSDHKYMSLLTYIKHYKEEYYTLFGRKVENSKQDPLAADANLTIGTAEQIAKNYDEKVLIFIDDFNKRFGTNYVLCIDEDYDEETKNNHGAAAKIKITEGGLKNSDAGELLE